MRIASALLFRVSGLLAARLVVSQPRPRAPRIRGGVVLHRGVDLDLDGGGLGAPGADAAGPVGECGVGVSRAVGAGLAGQADVDRLARDPLPEAPAPGFGEAVGDAAGGEQPRNLGGEAARMAELDEVAGVGPRLRKRWPNMPRFANLHRSVGCRRAGCDDADSGNAERTQSAAFPCRLNGLRPHQRPLDRSQRA